MSLESDLEMLRTAQPAWRAEGIGIRGNAVDLQKEQTRVDWPGVTLERRSGEPLAGVAQAGKNEAQSTTPAR